MKPLFLAMALVLLLLAACTSTGQFTVRSEPAGAAIFIDSKMVGKTPATLSIPFPENRQLVMEKKILSLRLTGYQEIREVLCYEGDSCKLLNFKLVPEKPVQ
jgi:PEGA domain